MSSSVFVCSQCYGPVDDTSALLKGEPCCHDCWSREVARLELERDRKELELGIRDRNGALHGYGKRNGRTSKDKRSDKDPKPTRNSASSLLPSFIANIFGNSIASTTNSSPSSVIPYAIGGYVGGSLVVAGISKITYPIYERISKIMYLDRAAANLDEDTLKALRSIRSSNGGNFPDYLNQYIDGQPNPSAFNAYGPPDSYSDSYRDTPHTPEPSYYPSPNIHKKGFWESDYPNHNNGFWDFALAGLWERFWK